MILTNIETVPGKKIVKHLGLVQGSTVRAKHVGRDIFASVKNIFGGELKGYTELMKESRKEATKRMVKQGNKIGANAIINVRFATSSIAQGAAELFIYGTAVIVNDIEQATHTDETNESIPNSSHIAYETPVVDLDPDAAFRKPTQQ